MVPFHSAALVPFSLAAANARARELMIEFYRLLWIEKKSKAVALWEAKRALRNKDAPLKDWAGWILTGDPGP